VSSIGWAQRSEPQARDLPGCIDPQSMLADTEEELETAVPDREVTAELP
jgi:hypothetical protein